MENSIFNKLNAVDVSAYIENKNGLNYLSWSRAWGELKKICPNAKYTVYENKDGWNYHTDGHTCWVKTGVEIDGIEYIEYLPVMDFRNKSITLENITSFDVNKTIQRSLTKAVARHGLGLYIYAGEDLPETDKEMITDTQIDELLELGVDLGKLAIAYKVGSYKNLTKAQATDAINRKLEQRAKNGK